MGRQQAALRMGRQQAALRMGRQQAALRMGRQRMHRDVQTDTDRGKAIQAKCFSGKASKAAFA